MSNSTSSNGLIRIGSVPGGASTEQLDQIAQNKQKIPSLFRLLAEHKLSEKEIWEGDHMLFSILYQFKEHLNKTESPPNIITFHLPSLPEFGDIKKKSYKINKKFTISQAISLICKKQMIPDPKRFWIGSLQGFIMSDNETLASYGLSSLFESWELRLILKEDILSKSPYRYQPLESIGTEFIVVFELPPLEQFNGLKKHVVKVDSNTTIKQSITSICKKYRVENPDRFSAMTIDENPLVEFVLFGGACYKHYGLGFKFKKWDLKIVFNDLIPPYVHRHTVIPMHGWTQVSPGQLDPFTARTIINDLEGKCQEYQAHITKLNQDIEGGNQVSAAHVQEIERLREEIKRLNQIIEEEREATQQQNEIYEGRISAGNAEIENQVGQLKLMRGKFDDVSHQLNSLKAVHEELQSSYNICKAEKESLEAQLSETSVEVEEFKLKLSTAKASAVESEQNFTAMIATLEREKASIKDEVLRVINEKADTEESAKALQANQALVVTQLQGDISSLRRESELMNLSLQKATVERKEAVVLQERAEKKMVEMQSEKKRVERQFGDLERERDVLRQQVQIKVDEIADVQKDLEWSRETVADLERRLVNLTGECQMFKDIKNKEVEKNKKSNVEESKTKNELEQEKQKTLNIQTQLQKRIHDLESKQKNQENAFRNAEQSFKKRELDLAKEMEEYREKYEQLRQSISNGSIKEGAKVETLPPSSVSNLVSNNNRESLVTSPILLNNGTNSNTKEQISPDQSSDAPPKDFAVVADGLYKSLQNRFQTTNKEGVEELELSEEDSY
ncbi:hypothetical protein DICPUDRAFT_75206 [Dictyostelium purpureum]|uniref:Ubiquitin-like domain-containing protein n=1 Tax=Dictyostelium purpureum TaxID=5786 RepID=F0Z9Z6_DICPU|nr:uncharacterized protein DICPUDRAFT_75206 [Dictyostelium purpureum]EGC39203.1 hypothetical protein DICPUDRAFT_75206 [Dictyostelium purpureum]|eukprot:XP_003284230.1 hypothetical protein DICPUDRAFT_75206 [Dictyostelium purpureum]